MFGGVPIIGGIESALMGQNNYRARAPSTAAGTAAIQQQMALASRRAAGAQHSAIASARGPGSTLMAREGMRRGAMAQQAGLEQGGILQKQLEQNALDQQMRAQEINARISGENAQGLGRLAGTALGAMAVFSDERTKNVIGDKYAGATGGPDDGRRVIWGQQSSMADERDKVAADAKAAGVRLGASDYEAMGYAPPAGLAAPTTAPVARPVAAQPVAQPPNKFGQLSQMMGLMQQQYSDKRAKVLESENASLKQALLQVSGVPTTPSMRKAMPQSAEAAARAKVLPDVTSVQSDGKRARVTSEHSAPLGFNEQVRLDRLAQQQPLAPRPVQVANMAPAPSPLSQLTAAMARPVRSDEDSKQGRGGVDLEFPEGVEPKAFRYKPEFSDGDPGVHYGVMAQDLEKSREGATTVSEDPATGMKQVDPGRLTMLNTAALADLEHRLRRLEGGRG